MYESLYHVLWSFRRENTLTLLERMSSLIGHCKSFLTLWQDTSRTIYNQYQGCKITDSPTSFWHCQSHSWHHQHQHRQLQYHMMILQRKPGLLSASRSNSGRKIPTKLWVIFLGMIYWQNVSFPLGQYRSWKRQKKSFLGDCPQIPSIVGLQGPRASFNRSQPRGNIFLSNKA